MASSRVSHLGWADWRPRVTVCRLPGTRGVGASNSSPDPILLPSSARGLADDQTRRCAPRRERHGRQRRRPSRRPKWKLPDQQDPTDASRCLGVMALLMAFMVINYGDRAVLALAARPVTSELGLSAQQYGLIRTAGNSPSAMA